MLDEAVNFDWWLTAATWSPTTGLEMEPFILSTHWQPVDSWDFIVNLLWWESNEQMLTFQQMN